MKKKYLELEQIIERDGFKCKMCGRVFDVDLLRRLDYDLRCFYARKDHVLTSRLKMVFFNLSNYIESVENKQILCCSCNIKKGFAEDKFLYNKFSEINEFVYDFRYRTDSKKEETKPFLAYHNFLDNKLKDEMEKAIKKYNITKQDFFVWSAYKHGRIEPTNEDYENQEIKNLLDFCFTKEEK